MRRAYDYDSNRVYFRRKSGHTYDLSLRGNITIVNGLSASGKTMVCNDIQSIRDLNSELIEYDVSNIRLITSSTDKIDDSNILYIIDKAERILTDDLCKRIVACNNARFLIFTRLAHNLGVSPNHFGEFVKNEDGSLISIRYYFNEKGW